MSWLFSQALVAAYSAGISLDGEPSAPLSGNPTQLAYLPPDKMTAFSRLSRFGMTFRPLTDDLGEAVLMSFLEAFPARTSALPAKAQESPESAAECGDTWRASLARFDPDSCSWKTVQHSLLEDSASSSVTWPRSGMTAGGRCWELPMSGRRISGIGSGLSPDGVKTFHTPTTNGLDGGSNSRKALQKKATWPTPQTRGFTNDGDLMALGEMCDSWEEMSAMAYRASEKKAMYWPTPTASQARSEGMIMQLRALVDAGTLTREEAETMAQGSLTPPRMKSWPTPTVCGNYNRKGASATSGDGLATAVKKWPTPTVNDSKNSTLPPSQIKHDNIPEAMLRDGQAPGGQLNPTWVEWLMGWPLGWTDLKPLATDKSLYAPQQLGGS